RAQRAMPGPACDAIRRRGVAPMRPTIGAAIALALAGCQTDVSGTTGFGTAGWIVTGLSTGVGVHEIAAGNPGGFVSTETSIEYCSRTDCAGWTDLAFATGHVAAIVSDGDTVYWTETINGTASGRVASCAETGCGPEGGHGNEIYEQQGDYSTGFL